MNSKIDYVIIVGCGELGSRLADTLSKLRMSIVVIDRNESAFKRLHDQFSGFPIEGDGTEEDTLIDAEIKRADVVVAATGDDNTNIMIAQIARVVYNVPRVIARLYEPARAQVFGDLEIETICPVGLSIREFFNLVNLPVDKEDIL